MNTLDAFYRFMSGYASFLEQMAESEELKHLAVVSYDQEEMDRAISEQQAILMRLEGMEKQRLQAQADAGFEGLRFREIIDRLDGADQERFTELFQNTEKTIEDIKFSNEKSLAAAKANLQTLAALSSETNREQKGYSAEGKKAQSAGTSLFDANI